MFGSKAGIVSGTGIWILIATASVVYVYLGYLNLTHLRAGIDLGTYTQILSEVSHHTVPSYNTLKGAVAWGDHAHFILALFAPLFTLYPKAMFVVVLQVIAITTSAWAMYAIAQKKIKNYFFSWSVVFSYLLFFGVQYALDFDFHANTLTAAAIAWTLYAFETNRLQLFWITFVLGLLTREDAPVFYVMFGVFLLFTYRLTYWKRAAGIIAIATVYFFAVTYWIMPMWQPSGTALAYFDAPVQTQNPVELGWWIVRNPITIWQNMTDTDIAKQTMKNLFASFGFLPLGSVFTYLLALPNFLARFLSGEEQRHMMQYHYSVSLASILAYGSIRTTFWITRYTRNIFTRRYIQQGIIVFFGAALLVGTYRTSLSDIELPLHRLVDKSERERFYGSDNVLADFYDLADNIGPEDSVAATSSLVPFLAARKEIFALPEPLASRAVDWVIIGAQGASWPLNSSERATLLQDLIDSPEYERVDRQGKFVLLKHVDNQ